MDKYIRLNVAIIPPKEISDLVIKISQKFSKELKTEFVLDGINFYPHITCYSVEYPSKNLDRIVEEIKNISKDFNKFQVKLQGLKTAKEGNAWGIGIPVEKNSEIDELHKLIIVKLNPLREGHLREKYKNPGYVAKFPENKREIMIRIMLKVGYARVLDVYEPHISITQFKPTVKKSDIKLPKLNIKNMKVENLGIFTMGEWGTCKKLLYKFSLK